jgi:hypothetical protein
MVNAINEKISINEIVKCKIKKRHVIQNKSRKARYSNLSFWVHFLSGLLLSIQFSSPFNHIFISDTSACCRVVLPQREELTPCKPA